MDPYIERSEIWPDFHDRFITYLCAALKPLLLPRYVALTQDRLYVVEAERPIRPDISVVETHRKPDAHAGQIAVVEPDAPAVFELWRDEVRQPLIQIVEPAAGNRIVTAIEVLSPDNKAPGAGRTSYLQKREEFWSSGTNLVEIDLLRHGDSTVRIAAEKLDTLRPWHYLVAVTRRWPPQQEIYATHVRRRLPAIRVPLASGDSDVVLDVQSVFARCWDEGPYPQLLEYFGRPPGELAQDDLTWCEQLLLKSEFKTAATK
jgi:hypothetical protein